MAEKKKRTPRGQGKQSTNPKGIASDSRHWTTWRLYTYYKNNTPDQNIKLFEKLRGTDLTKPSPLYDAFLRYITEMDGFVPDENGKVNKASRDAAMKWLTPQAKGKGGEETGKSLNEKEAERELDGMDAAGVAKLIGDNLSTDQLRGLLKARESE